MVETDQYHAVVETDQYHAVVETDQYHAVVGADQYHAVVETDQYHASTNFRPLYYINHRWLFYNIYMGAFDLQIILWIYLTSYIMMFCRLKLTIVVRIPLCSKGLKYAMYVRTNLC